MHSVQILNSLVEHHQVWAYFVLFLGLVFEGEVIVITAGVLSYLGALDFTTALLFILAGGVAKTFGCYYLGVILYRRYSEHRFFKYLEKRVMYFMPKFKEKPFWSIFISKFINGVNYLVLIFSGYNRINMKTYLKAEFLSLVIWAPLLLSLGYFFSQTALSFSKEIGRFSLVILALVIVFLMFDKLVAAVYRVLTYIRIVNENNGHK